MTTKEEIIRYILTCLSMSDVHLEDRNFIHVKHPDESMWMFRINSHDELVFSLYFRRAIKEKLNLNNNLLVSTALVEITRDLFEFQNEIII
jgi:hypothetical protein